MKKSNRYNDVKIRFMRNDEENNSEISSISLSYIPRKFSHANRWRCNFLIVNGTGFQSPTAIHQFVLFTKFCRASSLQNPELIIDYILKHSAASYRNITLFQITLTSR